ncbi:FHA domain-containing protein [Rhodopirellula sallentina]|uniref:Forkhead-associated domain protein n=1 Tax=Rhodopirellula sallentina SM41 TaxID=1263870 RepID=M5U9F7_9BACT|nr:FHA domain-containing protein [Rhodopirellula sallentina]EMI52618.1 Forkhead-associated domain protein [Rhodopirellula sallentina SM41]
MSFLDVFDYQLVHRNGDERGEVIHIEEGKTVIGRSEKCHVHLASPDVSRQHCVLVRTKTQLFVYDLSSRNGTKVNRQRIASKKPVELRHRDKLQIGRWKFRFLVKDALSGESIPDEPKVVDDAKASAPRTVLNELDAIAEALDLPSGEITETKSIPRDFPSEANNAAPSAAKPEKPNKPQLNEASPAPEKAEPEQPAFDPTKKRQPISLPASARLSGASDPRTAADQTLRKLFGR